MAYNLVQQGWSIWWDKRLRSGQFFDRLIEEALDQSKCLVVVWSRNSTASDWVRAEASEGLRRGILVPVLIDDATLPLPFRNLYRPHSCWSGTESSSGLTSGSSWTTSRASSRNLSSVAQPIVHAPPVEDLETCVAAKDT